MNRIYKNYELNYNHASIVSKKSSFSSYPGMIFSSDDFYILDTGLVLIETTINILNEDLYSKCNPDGTIMAWVRNLVANRISRDGAQWTQAFAKYNSGTYNNQWFVIDYNKFNPSATDLQPGTLYVMEQIPGYIKIRDNTDVLEKEGYWASFNRPYFKEVNQMSMFEKYANVHGEMFSYENCNRAKIFQREQSKIKTVGDMKRLMRLNEYETDPISAGCPGEAIAARYDLPAVPGAKCEVSSKPNGATDSKITTFGMVPTLQSLAIGGPTYDDQPVF